MWFEAKRCHLSIFEQVNVKNCSTAAAAFLGRGYSNLISETSLFMILKTWTDRAAAYCDRYFWRIIRRSANKNPFMYHRGRKFLKPLGAHKKWRGRELQEAWVSHITKWPSPKFEGLRQNRLCHQLAAQIYNIWHAIMEMSLKIRLEASSVLKCVITIWSASTDY